MRTENDRRSYRRESIHIPLHIRWDETQNSPCPGWVLDASPSGLLLELSEAKTLKADTQVNLSFGLQEYGHIDLGTGIVRHTALRNGQQVLGVKLKEESPLLFCPSIMGTSPSLLEIKSLLSQIRSTELNILIRGETGTGKNVLAKAIHNICKGESKPFIRVNCPSIPEDLFESELFGHEKGAYTDAKSSAPGYFRLAAEGTILLDEISEIHPHLQAKLLRVVEDKQFKAVGGDKLIPVRANIIATTNIDLEQAVDQGTFRRDLFYRLCEMPFYLPSLRERKGDIVLLAHHFLYCYCKQFCRPFRTLNNSEIDILSNHSWPGNIRELENYMKQTALLKKFAGPSEDASHSPSESENFLKAIGVNDTLLSSNGSLTEITKKLTSEIEYKIIAQTLHACGQNRTKAASRLGISYRTLLRKLELHQSF